MKLQRTAIFLLITCLAWSIDLSKQVIAATTQGEFSVQFEKESPLAETKELARRTRLPDKPEKFDLSAEHFRAYVPTAYSADEAYGLLVWINAGKTGHVPRKEWERVLDEHKLIWIGADDTGNDRPLSSRIRLAVDGMFNMTTQYKIDPNRIYVAGMSGGGRVSSMVAILYGDVFAGGLFCCGVNFYREIPVPNQPGKVWPQQFYGPVEKITRKNKATNRYVLLTGDNDMNLDNTKAIYESGYLKDGFKFVTYLQVPGMGHSVPEAEWFEKAIVALDAPLTDPKWQATTQPVKKKK